MRADASLGVIRLAPPRIPEDFVGARCLEKGDGAVVSRDVGMISASELPIGTPDVVSAGVW
jgi:hypothetical protein